MPDQNLPTMAEITRQLASDNERVQSFVNGMPQHIDQLVEAAKAEEWQEVKRVSDYISRSTKLYGYPEVAERADRVTQAMNTPENELEVKRSVLKLISEYGRMRGPMEKNSMS